MNALFARLTRLAAGAFSFRRRRRQQRAALRLEESGLFDRAWYLEAYPDVRDSGIEPVRHYLLSGWREGRDPGPSFSTLGYLRSNADVVALGVNPLLHYVDHGHAEGRATADHGAPARPSLKPIETFPAAAPCVSFPLATRSQPDWVRFGRTWSSGLPAAVAEAGAAALSYLAWLSGVRSDSCPEVADEAAGFELQDAWHAGSQLFRTRWTCGVRPVVVRVIQQVGEAPELIGEGLVDELAGIVDARLRNPYFPLLFLFTEPDGTYLGCDFMAFPSLRRGGVHYAEFLSLKGSSPEQVDGELRAGLGGIREGRANPLVRDLSVRVDGADGTSPLFQGDFQTWFAGVMRVGSQPAPGSKSVFLSSAVRVDADSSRKSGLALLQLRGDVIPSLSALCATGTGGEDRTPRGGSLILCNDDPSRGSLLVSPPSVQANGSAADGFPSLLPETGLDPNVELPLLGLRRLGTGAVSDARLLRPERTPTPSAGDARLAWFVFTDDWSRPQLLEALDTLALQTIGPVAVVLVGEASANVAGEARSMGLSVRTSSLPAAALRDIKTDYVGYLGAGVLLHDRESSARLLPHLAGNKVLSISAPVLGIVHRGKISSLEPLEPAGKLALGELGAALVALDQPPPHFWIAPVGRARDWLSGVASNGYHLCSTETSVSCLDASRAARQIVPASAADASAQTGLLVG